MLKSFLFLSVTLAGVIAIADGNGNPSNRSGEQSTTKYYQSFSTRADSITKMAPCFAVDSDGKFYYNSDPEYVCKADNPVRPEYLSPIVPASGVRDLGEKDGRSGRALDMARFGLLEMGQTVDVGLGGGNEGLGNGATYAYRSADGTAWFFKYERNQNPARIRIIDYRGKALNEKGEVWKADIHYSQDFVAVGSLVKPPAPRPVEITPVEEVKREEPAPVVIRVPQKETEYVHCPALKGEGGKTVDSLNSNLFCDNKNMDCLLTFACKIGKLQDCDGQMCMAQFDELQKRLGAAFDRVKNAKLKAAKAQGAYNRAFRTHNDCLKEGKDTTKTTPAVVAAQRALSAAKNAEAAAWADFEALVNESRVGESAEFRCIKPDGSIKEFYETYRIATAVSVKYKYVGSSCGPGTAVQGGASGTGGAGDRGRNPDSIKNGKKNMNKMPRY